MSDTLQITSNGVIEEEGYYLNTDGHVSSTGKLQDNHYYQDFSYEIETGVSTNFYRDSVTEYLHPVGTKMFGRYMWETEVPVMPVLPPPYIRYDYHQDGPFVMAGKAVELDTVGIATRNCFGVPVTSHGAAGDIALENNDGLQTEDSVYVLEHEGRAVGGWANVEPQNYMWFDIGLENGDLLVFGDNDADTYSVNIETIYCTRYAHPTPAYGNVSIDTTNIQINLDAGMINSYPLNSRTVAEDWVEGISTQDGFIICTRPEPQYSRIIG